MRHPKGGLQYLRQSHASLASFGIMEQVSHYVGSLNTIVDVGANQGQFALAATRFFPGASVHSFEPVPETYAKLVKNLGGQTRVTTYNYGLGSKEGKIEFYRNEHSHASSALPISEFQKKEIPGTSNTTLIKIPVKKLDDVLTDVAQEGRPILLKLDVQGYEKEVIKGALDFIRNVDYLLFEASFIRMYEGEPLFDEMHKLVTGLGFELIGPIGSLEIGDSRIVQMDMLYKRAT